MNGGLRRRAGGRDGFNMSDSEDEDDMRLRKRRADFQKMNKALLADERIGDIAKDQKKAAFFHTLADFADLDEYDYFLDGPGDAPLDDDQSQSQEEVKGGEAIEDATVPDSQAADAVNMSAPVNRLKRKSPESQKENRPPPHLRRTAATDSFSRKPITFADIQHSVSELLEDPRIMVPDSQFSESESDDEPPAPIVVSRKPIIDRLSLSRTASLSEAAGADDNMAFHAPSRSANAPGFRVPSLIRQATSNLSATSDSRRPSGASTSSEAVRRGGTGKSNIHAQSREAERRVMLDKKDSKRKEALKKKVSAGRKGGMRSVLRDLGGGFDE
jgi:mediator of replication checkpoint protein 1